VNHLLVPPVGLLEVFEEAETEFDSEGALVARGGEGTLTTMTYVDLVIRWFVNDVGPVNRRARETLVEIGGPHSIFTGPVMFSGLPAEEVVKVVAHLSRKE